jgi:hypothetical protein
MAVFFKERLPNLFPIFLKFLLHQFAVIPDEAAILQQGLSVLLELHPTAFILMTFGLISCNYVLSELNVLLCLPDKLGKVFASKQPVEQVLIGLSIGNLFHKGSVVLGLALLLVLGVLPHSD